MFSFTHLTGTFHDSLINSFGLRTYKLRYGGTEVKPTPAIADKYYEGDNDLSGEVMPGEQVRTYSTSIPVESLKLSKIDIEEAVVCDAIWELWNGTDWIAVRVREVPRFNPVGQRFGMSFVEAGIGEEYSA